VIEITLLGTGSSVADPNRAEASTLGWAGRQKPTIKLSQRHNVLDRRRQHLVQPVKQVGPGVLIGRQLW